MRALAAIAFALPLVAAAQSFPLKPVRIVTQFVPGSSGDTAIRVITPGLSKALGQPVIIDNRAGAGGVLAAEQVVRSPADGHTLFYGSSALYVIRPFLVKDMPFDPSKDLAPVTQYLDSVAYLVAHPSFPAATLKEFLEHARSSPGKVTFGTSGIGTEGHLTGEEIMELTGVKLVHVPYKAAAQALTDTVAGQITTTFSTYSGALPHLRAGKLKVIAVVKDVRTTQLPNVGTMAETIPGFEAPPAWAAVFAPAGIPLALARRVQSEIGRAAKEPDAHARLVDGGFDVLASSPEEFAARIKREIALVARLVKTAGIKPE
jgi:tripartite-type tricarboxylate transporter receptor subunit TctC